MEHQTDITKPRVYVACLAAYNNGHLHGAWIDANQDAWSIYDGIAAMLRASPVVEAEEWAIHDYEGFEGVRLSEHAGIDRVAEIAAFIAEHGRLGADLITYYGGIADARSAMEEQYAGEYASLGEFAEELTAETTSIPEPLRHYIDWQAMARDMAVNDVVAFETDRDGVHVFRSR